MANMSIFHERVVDSGNLIIQLKMTAYLYIPLVISLSCHYSAWEFNVMLIMYWSFVSRKFVNGCLCFRSQERERAFVNYP